MIRTIEQLFSEALTTRDFIFSRELDDTVVGVLVDDDWKDYSVAKRDLVFQAMLIGYECLMKKSDPRKTIEAEIKGLKVGSKETVDLGQLYSFLDKERGVVALSLLISMFGPLYISEHINEIFPALRALAEDGLRVIKREVIDRKLTVIKKQMETVAELPVRVRNGEIQC